jgi:hypothetical protein
VTTAILDNLAVLPACVQQHMRRMQNYRRATAGILSSSAHARLCEYNVRHTMGYCVTGASSCAQLSAHCAHVGAAQQSAVLAREDHGLLQPHRGLKDLSPLEGGLSRRRSL